MCKTTIGLHKHHIYEGTDGRQKSEQYGCWCYLCGKHHNLSNEGVHFNPYLDNKIKRYTQEKFTEVYPNIDFMSVFNRNYRKEE